MCLIRSKKGSEAEEEENSMNWISMCVLKYLRNIM